MSIEVNMLKRYKIKTKIFVKILEIFVKVIMWYSYNDRNFEFGGTLFFLIWSVDISRKVKKKNMVHILHVYI